MSHVIYPTTNLKATEQMVVERGEGIYIYDNQGKQYLEGMAGLWCTGLGYDNRELIDSYQRAAGEAVFLPICLAARPTRRVSTWRTSSAAMVPVPDARVFFGNSGSDANDTHIKLLRYYFNAIGKPEKRKIITRERAYHGVTVAAGSLTSLPANLAHFDAPAGGPGHICAPTTRTTTAAARASETEAEFVDAHHRQPGTVDPGRRPGDYRRVFAEPITGASGVIVPPAGYYEKVQAILASTTSCSGPTR